MLAATNISENTQFNKYDSTPKFVDLQYADDLVLFGRNERDLQHMLEVVNQWCSVWNVTVNSDKSQIVHFRPRAVNCTCKCS